MHVLDGDLSQEHMGVRLSELKPVVATFNYVIHCAASIELEAEVTNTLKQNYCGTEVGCIPLGTAWTDPLLARHA